MAFKKNSNLEQERLRRPTPRKFGDFIINPTHEELRENLCAMKRKLDEELRSARMSPERRMQLKMEATRLRDELHRLGGGKKYGKTFNNYLCDVIRADVSLAQWKIWVAKTEKLCVEKGDAK